MESERRPSIRGFRTLCLVVSALYLLLGGSMVFRGARAAMAPFEVPEPVLSSPHFGDFFHWVFVHMMVLGVMIGMLGRFVDDGRSQRIIAGVLAVVQAHYAYLDLRTSDSAIGSRLYHGPGSLVPPLIDAVVTLSFAALAIFGRARGLPLTKRD